MKTDELPIAILAFVAFVAVIPAWTFYLDLFSAQQPQDAFLAGLVIPAAAALFLTSWIKPEFSALVLGGFMLIGIILMYPWWFEMTDMISAALVDNPMAQFLLQLAIPVLVLSFLVTLGRRRIQALQ